MTLDTLIAFACAGTEHRLKPPTWTPEEDQFLRDSMDVMTDAEIGQALGRSENAVKLRWCRDLQLPARSKVPGLVTAHEAAGLLGLDGHKLAHWVDAGLVPGREMPGERTIRLIEYEALKRWAVNPRNWVYFDWTAVRDAKIRRLCELRAARWGDEWWTTSQVAEYHGVSVKFVITHIRRGRVKAFHLPVSLSGRHADRTWSNWFVLRSDALKAKFYRLGEEDRGSRVFTPRADAWLLYARDELGMTFEAIGRTMKIGKRSNKTNPTIAYRYHQLKSR